LPAHQRITIGDRHLAAAGRVRQALATVAPLNQAVLLWVALGGSLSGYATFTRTRDGAAAERLREAVGALVRHYDGPLRAGGGRLRILAVTVG
jgi:hypothetical protein